MSILDPSHRKPNIDDSKSNFTVYSSVVDVDLYDDNSINQNREKNYNISSGSNSSQDIAIDFDTNRYYTDTQTKYSNTNNDNKAQQIDSSKQLEVSIRSSLKSENTKSIRYTSNTYKTAQENLLELGKIIQYDEEIYLDSNYGIATADKNRSRKRKSTIDVEYSDQSPNDTFKPFSSEVDINEYMQKNPTKSFSLEVDLEDSSEFLSKSNQSIYRIKDKTDSNQEQFKKAKDPPGINSLFPENTASKRTSARRIPSKRLEQIPGYVGESSRNKDGTTLQKQDKSFALKKLIGVSGSKSSHENSAKASLAPKNAAQTANNQDGQGRNRKMNGFSLLRRNELKYVKPDSRYGWQVVFCAFIIHFFATSNSGLMYLYTKEHIRSFSVNHTYDQTLGYTNKQVLYSILGSLFMCFGGIFSSYLSFRTSFSLSAFLGSIIMSSSLVISSFTSTAGAFYIIRNIIFGFGLGLAFYPAYILPCHWFKKHVGLATGVALSGTLLGIKVFFPLYKYTLDNLGTKSTLRIQGLVILISCTIASAGLKSHYLKNSTLKFFNFSLFYDTRFLVLSLVSLLTWFGQISLSLFISDLCYINGFSTYQEILAIMILYVGSFIGLLVFGIASDRFGSLKIIGISMILSGLFSAIFWSFASSFAVVVLYFILVGMSNSGVAVALPIAAQNLFGLVNVPGTLSILFYSSSFIAITVVPSLRVPSDAYNEYKNESRDLIVFGGISMLVAGVLCIFLPKMQHDYITRIFKRNSKKLARQQSKNNS
ncbi:hypothetical protein BB561_004218 [Smittium simulii]|uniref:Major facilitator superfamily (MFS) profile domain-containing protein n=1 Tax=Smittium simulii TaxID=133385 RepID=A0A2T9YHI2_9FUNG|nr:hypothetical protein BB561_004218 [Smittium simulii]